MSRFVWPLTVLLVVASAVAEFSNASVGVQFLLCCLAIIPLAGIMGTSTEAIAAHAGPRIGGLLSATFGNAVELIIGIIALTNGLTGLVKASITGSLIGNLLFVLGISFFVGGIKHPIQQFNIRAARSNAAMLLLAVGVAFVVPAVFSVRTNHTSILLSYTVAIVMLVLYLAGLFFALFTHRHVFEYIETESAAEGEKRYWRLWPAVGILLVATVVVGFESDWLVNSMTSVGASLGWSDTFLGVVVVAIIGNAAEHASAVWMAWKNRMDLSLEIAVGSSLQVTMFVAPVLFIASMCIGAPMPLIFSWPELAAMGAAVMLVIVLLVDGESNWLEGLMAVGAYLVLAVGFYTVPGM